MKQNLKFLFILGLLIFSGVSAWQVYFKTYTQADTINIHQFPRNIDGWESRDLIITEEEYALLETRNAFVREYTEVETGDKIYLFIVYSQNNRKVSHPPEICYTGNGFSVVNSSLKSININEHEARYGNHLLSNRLLLERGTLEQISYYWFKVGGQFTSNYWKQQALIVANTLLGRPASSALIRISSNVHDRDYHATENTIHRFAKLVIPDLFHYLP